MDLKCKKLNCVYNDKYSCIKKAIKVSRTCECDSFEPARQLKDGQKQDVSKTMFETAPDFHAYRHKKDIDIECDAECLFNRNHSCHANGISVCNCTNCALCATFIKD